MPHRRHADAPDDVAGPPPGPAELADHLGLSWARLQFVDGLSQREIGVVIGVSQMQVSRLLSAILEILHTTLHDEFAGSSAY